MSGIRLPIRYIHPIYLDLSICIHLLSPAESNFHSSINVIVTAFSIAHAVHCFPCTLFYFSLAIFMFSYAYGFIFSPLQARVFSWSQAACRELKPYTFKNNWIVRTNCSYSVTVFGRINHGSKLKITQDGFKLDGPMLQGN